MMRRIHRHRLRCANNPRQPRPRLDTNRVRLLDRASGAVIDLGMDTLRIAHRRLDILHQRTRPIHIQRLQPIANAEHRLVQLVGIRQQHRVNAVALRVRGAVFSCRSAPYFRGSRSARLPGSRTPSQCSICFITCAGVRSSSMRTGSPPAPRTAFSYCGKARSAYSRSPECGTGMAMRGAWFFGSPMLNSPARSRPAPSAAGSSESPSPVTAPARSRPP